MNAARTRKPDRSERGGTLRFIITLAILAWLLRSLAFAAFSIPSGSMLPTLQIGDYLFVSKWPYGYSRFSFPLGIPSFDGRIFEQLPTRGDVVVFVPPGHDGVDFVKRVIALPGDTVEIRRGRVLLNGKPLRRDDMRTAAITVSANSPCRTVAGARPHIAATGDTRTCLYRSYRETLPNGASYRVIDQVNDGSADTFAATVVPAGRLFLMGDNRDDSLDSRFSTAEGGIGFVPIDHLVGRASVLFWSTDGGASYLKPWTWFSALRARRLGRSLAPLRND